MADKLVKDYEGFRAFMLEEAKRVMPEWTDQSSNDFGVVLLELLAKGLDVIGYYADRNYNEASLATAQLRSRVVELAMKNGYEPSDQIPAKFVQTFSKHPDDIAETLIVPKGTVVYTKDTNVVFETDADLVVGAGTLSGTVGITQGLSTSGSVGVSTGQASQKFKMEYPNLLLDSIRILITDLSGVEREYTRVKKSQKYEYNDQAPIFFVEVDGDNVATVIFGDALHGKIPPVGHSIRYVAKQASGLLGNVGVRTIVELDATIPFLYETSNETMPTQYGANVESVDSIREKAVLAGRADFIVNAKDAEYHALLHPSVFKVKAVETFSANNELDIYFVSSTMAVPDSTAKNAVKAYLDSVKKVANLAFVMKDPTINAVTASLTVVIDGDYSRVEKTAEITELILKTFGKEASTFNSAIIKEHIFATMMKVEGVSPLSVVNTPATVAGASTKINYISSVSISISGGTA